MSENLIMQLVMQAGIPTAVLAFILREVTHRLDDLKLFMIRIEVRQFLIMRELGIQVDLASLQQGQGGPYGSD